VISRKSARYRKRAAIARVSATDKLIPFAVSAMTDNQFMIDSESLSISSDGILRYTLVIVSPSGAQNVSLRGNQLCDWRASDLCPWPLGPDMVKGAQRSVGKNRDNSLNRHHAELLPIISARSALPFAMPTKSARRCAWRPPSMMRR
jgi:hypothetical protein